MTLKQYFATKLKVTIPSTVHEDPCCCKVCVYYGSLVKVCYAWPACTKQSKFRALIHVAETEEKNGDLTLCFYKQ